MLSSKLTSSEHCYKTFLGKGLFFPVPVHGGLAAPHEEERTHGRWALPQPQNWDWGLAGWGCLSSAAG